MKIAEIYTRIMELKDIPELDMATRLKLADLAHEIYRDMRSVPEPSRKAAAAVLKKLLKNAERVSPGRNYQYTWINAQGLQCVMDSIRAYRLHDAFDLPRLPVGTVPYDIDRICEQTKQQNKTIIPPIDYGELKAYVEIQRATLAPRDRVFWEFGDGLPITDAEYLLDMLTVFPDAQIYAGGVHAPLYFASERGDGILCVVRKG